ncbi:hypothetical protein NC796_11490 [Aliifodinibius sp. S!AR15-10]|uniref:hypothetical protein n=1 Tax=Aliifodinibius sp. S!AR15-10 TaxID=2950437 RepID=UPI00285D09E2|nr:hypothetical protein [Aliifodinibius sp. S!AR15-10]MDR8391770.1 hypothetical protein [Aliifodinibius sp. S!AR15-10]
MYRAIIQLKRSQLLLILFAVTLVFVACEGLTGPEGPQGAEGSQGPVGPAGDDGSMMYADEGPPSSDIGDIGDFYLNTNTGEYHGPKTEEGWGDPIIVLMGNDGDDGTEIHSGSGAPNDTLGVAGDFYIDLSVQNLYGPKDDSGWGTPIDLNGVDGTDGADGEDGSQIYSGDGAPKSSIGAVGDYYLDKTNKDLYGPKTDSGWGQPINLNGEDGQDGADGEDGSQIYSGDGAPDQSLGDVGDYYLDKTNYDLYGPKFTLLNTNSAIWGVPINLKGADGADGADGNANVTRYIYPGHDFDGEEIWEGIRHSLVMPSETAMRQSVWLMYGLKTSSDDIYSIPGSGGVENNFYDFSLTWLSGISAAQFHIFKVGGHGIRFNRFEIVRIESSNTVDFTGIEDDSRLPEDLDLSNYNEVARHFGF